MIPLPPWATLKLLKLAGIGIAVIAVGVLVWRITVWHDKAGKLDQAVKALATEKQGRADDLKTIRADLAKSEKDRKQLADDLDGIRAKFAAIPVPPPKALVTSREVPIAAGQTTCPDTRISPAFRLRWNSIATP